MLAPVQLTRFTIQHNQSNLAVQFTHHEQLGIQHQRRSQEEAACKFRHTPARLTADLPTERTLSDDVDRFQFVRHSSRIGIVRHQTTLLNQPLVHRRCVTRPVNYEDSTTIACDLAIKIVAKQSLVDVPIVGFRTTSLHCLRWPHGRTTFPRGKFPDPFPAFEIDSDHLIQRTHDDGITDRDRLNRRQHTLGTRKPTAKHLVCHSFMIGLVDCWHIPTGVRQRQTGSPRGVSLRVAAEHRPIFHCLIASQRSVADQFNQPGNSRVGIREHRNRLVAELHRASRISICQLNQSLLRGVLIVAQQPTGCQQDGSLWIKFFASIVVLHQHLKTGGGRHRLPDFQKVMPQQVSRLNPGIGIEEFS